VDDVITKGRTLVRGSIRTLLSGEPADLYGMVLAVADPRQARFRMLKPTLPRANVIHSPGVRIDSLIVSPYRYST